MSNFQSTKLIELGSCAFRQWRATSHCSKVHGYQLLAKFYFAASSLDEKNWVVDFASLKTLKALLQNQFDHTLCVAQDDPLLEIFQHLHNMGGCDLRIMDSVGIEKTAEFCFNAASSWLKDNYGDRCWVEKVEVFEHEANSAIFVKPIAITHSLQIPTAYGNAILLNEVKAVATEALPEVNIPSTTVVSVEPTEIPSSIDIIPFTDVPGPKPAQVGRGEVTQGWSNPFGGTSWGV
jgi:6-pyruvoyltetrahydropterin/6-carboxytetrahydropterin synthase